MSATADRLAMRKAIEGTEVWRVFGFNIDPVLDAILAALPIPATDEGWKRVSPGFTTTREAYEWLASRKPEAAPSDTDHAHHREAEEYVAGCPVCEANEELRLRMNAETARSRTSQPVQVEVTDDMVERALNVYRMRTAERIDVGAFRAALSAALGGGDHADR